MSNKSKIFEKLPRCDRCKKRILRKKMKSVRGKLLCPDCANKAQGR